MGGAEARLARLSAGRDGEASGRSGRARQHEAVVVPILSAVWFNARYQSRSQAVGCMPKSGDTSTLT